MSVAGRSTRGPVLFDSQLIAFTLVAAVLAVTPGVDTMLVLKNAIRAGSGPGWATTLGILAGTLVHALVSALGLSIIVARSETLFHVIKALGALYLVWLGVQAIRTAGHRAGTIETGQRRVVIRDAFMEGLVTNLLNPKVAVFYIAFLPQFISAQDPVLARSLLLACIHNGLSLLWLGGLVMLVSRGRRWIDRREVQQWLSRLSGVILIGLGLRLALESR